MYLNNMLSRTGRMCLILLLCLVLVLEERCDLVPREGNSLCVPLDRFPPKPGVPIITERLWLTGALFNLWAAEGQGRSADQLEVAHGLSFSAYLETLLHLT